jgi:hypothetical protein
MCCRSGFVKNVVLTSLVLVHMLVLVLIMLAVLVAVVAG